MFTLARGKLGAATQFLQIACHRSDRTSVAVLAAHRGVADFPAYKGSFALQQCHSALAGIFATFVAAHKKQRTPLNLNRHKEGAGRLRQDAATNAAIQATIL